MVQTATVYKFNDARAEVYMRLMGQKIADQAIGRANISRAINKAQGLVMVDIPELEVAGELYKVTPSSGIAVGATLTFAALSDPAATNNVLVPKFLTWANGTCRFLRAQDLLQVDSTPLITDEICYSFVGSNVHIRPTGASITGNVFLHYIKTPLDMTVAGNEALEVSPRLFLAVCLRAAWECLSHWRGVEPGVVKEAEAAYYAEKAKIMEEITGKAVTDYMTRTGRSTDGSAPGSGQ